MRRGKLDDDVKRKVKVNKDGRGRMGERKIKKKSGGKRSETRERKGGKSWYTGDETRPDEMR